MYSLWEGQHRDHLAWAQLLELLLGHRERGQSPEAPPGVTTLWRGSAEPQLRLSLDCQDSLAELVIGAPDEFQLL